MEKTVKWMLDNGRAIYRYIECWSDIKITFDLDLYRQLYLLVEKYSESSEYDPETTLMEMMRLDCGGGTYGDIWREWFVDYMGDAFLPHACRYARQKTGIDMDDRAIVDGRYESGPRWDFLKASGVADHLIGFSKARRYADPCKALADMGLGTGPGGAYVGCAEMTCGSFAAAFDAYWTEMGHERL